MEREKWKAKFSSFFNNCQDELKRTTAIGKKMISASKVNTELHQVFEELGRYTREQLRSKKLQWDDREVKQLLEKIDFYEQNLEEFEEGVKEIKSQEKFQG